MRSLTSIDETDARRTVARVGPTSGQRRRPRRNFTILRQRHRLREFGRKSLDPCL